MFAELKQYTPQLRNNLEVQVDKVGCYPPYHKVNGQVKDDTDRKRQTEIKMMLHDAIMEIEYLQTTLAKIELSKIVNPETTSRQEELPKKRVKQNIKDQ